MKKKAIITLGLLIVGGSILYESHFKQNYDERFDKDDKKELRKLDVSADSANAFDPVFDSFNILNFAEEGMNPSEVNEILEMCGKNNKYIVRDIIKQNINLGTLIKYDKSLTNVEKILSEQYQMDQKLLKELDHKYTTNWLNEKSIRNNYNKMWDIVIEIDKRSMNINDIENINKFKRYHDFSFRSATEAYFDLGLKPEVANEYNYRFDFEESKDLYKNGVMPEEANEFFATKEEYNSNVKSLRDMVSLDADRIITLTKMGKTSEDFKKELGNRLIQDM